MSLVSVKKYINYGLPGKKKWIRVRIGGREKKVETFHLTVPTYPVAPLPFLSVLFDKQNLNLTLGQTDTKGPL